jgi:serine/threonine-protein kinase
MAGTEEHLPVPLETVLGGKYRLDRLLGAGGFGTVCRATQLDLGRQVAVKVLHGGVSPEMLSRFQREARATGSLGHPHIAQVTDFQRRPPHEAIFGAPSALMRSL